MKSRTSLQILRAVWFALIVREVQALVGRRRMGAFWALAEPVLHLLAFSLFIGILRNRPDIAGHPYPVFLIVGLAPFLVYRRIIMATASGVGSARPLYAYKQISPIDSFVTRAIVALGLMTVAYILIVSGFIWYGWDMTIPRPIEWIGCILLGLAFSFALGLILAAVVNIIPESLVVIRIAFMPLYFISGVIIPASMMPPQLLQYLMWNPFLHITELTRQMGLEYFQPVIGISASYVIEVTVVMMFAGMGLYRVMRLKYIAIRG